ncbi:putative alanine racemase-domain-containing protein [Roridomyces roridus]|uniref:Alanine racemase-domain-containing protein n=1 Tax=Roridomyces roridus TaxID=1738132 RepID=A0AAD7FPN1_9AGAR|nr:putative alanine racemase-domain-containing protein [Roridomyces roridus]
MVSSELADAFDPTRVILSLYDQDIDSFPAKVAAHFDKIFASKDAFDEIPSLHTIDPRQTDRRLVSFRAMIQDTSPSPEMYLARHSNGKCGGWGLVDDSGTEDIDYSDLRENTVLWAVSVPGESPWVGGDDAPRPLFPVSHPHKFPVPEHHFGVQVKLYDTSQSDSLKSTDAVTLVGILTLESLAEESDSPNALPVLTLHVLFTRELPITIIPRVFPYVPAVSSVRVLREELISWMADEGLGGDKDAAEWVLLNIIGTVQSRTPPLLPLSLTLSRFPASKTPATTPNLSIVLSHLLPLLVTLPLSLETLNNSSFSPESKDEDLHSGRLQLPRGSVCVITEGGVTEGDVFDRGVRNLRALQEMMTNQTLEYIFPFSRFTFPTDVVCLVLSEGKKSTFFQTSTNVRIQPKDGCELYGSAVKLPSPESLAMFRDLVGGAKTGKVTQISESVAEYIQEDFVAERKSAPTPAEAVTSDDLIHRMMVARLLTLSMHQSEVTTEIWERVKVLERARCERLKA